jgi:7-cyano-7-deazaguanine synthase in queuosine biosynthesis
VRFTKPRCRLVCGASLIKITAIEDIPNTQALYDITVDRNHTFVGGSAGFIIAGQSGYPDCRPEFLKAFETLANLATKAGVEGGRFHIHAPLVQMSKAQIIQLGVSLGVDYSLTHSCYDPTAEGLACGRCDSCVLRRAGFAAAGVADPTRYAP